MLWEVPTVASVEERVIDIVCENLGVSKEQVTRETKFQEDVGADSLDIVELVMELEEEFDITIPDDQAEKIKTVGEATASIIREQGNKESPAASSSPEWAPSRPWAAMSRACGGG